MAYFTRKEWGARPWKWDPAWMSDESVIAIYLHWNGPKITLVGKALASAIQRFHLAGNFRDIAYSFLVDRKGNRMTGRGWNVQDGATSPSMAGRSYSIFAGIGEGQKAPVAMLVGIRKQVERIRARTGKPSLPVRPHLDAYATSCPGPELTEWVRQGMPVENDSKRPGKTVPLPSPEKPRLPKLGNAVLQRGDIRNSLPWRKKRIDALQLALGHLGYGLVGTGPWGRATAKAVRKFGKDAGIVDPDFKGQVLVGPIYWAALGSALERG